jgi:hypothetical protein
VYLDKLKGFDFVKKRQFKLIYFVCSLHEELIAQRALDRRLAEQLIQFKSTVGTLMLYVKIMLLSLLFFLIYNDDFETIF